LRDVLNHRNALEPDLFEVRRKILRPASVAFAELEARRGQRPRKLGALEERTAGGDDNTKVAPSYSFECLDPFASDLRVGLRFSEALAGRIKGDAFGLDQGAQIGKPPLGAGDVVVQHHEEPVRKIIGEGCYDHRVAGAVKSTYTRAGSRRWYFFEELSELSERLNNGEQLWERHGAR
jgi:hypothetical protein